MNEQIDEAMNLAEEIACSWAGAYPSVRDSALPCIRLILNERDVYKASLEAATLRVDELESELAHGILEATALALAPSAPSKTYYELTGEAPPVSASEQSAPSEVEP
jgi:hypothetical protein